MAFLKLFAKNNAQGIISNDSSSTITFEAGHTFPTDISSGEFLITLGGPGGEVVKVTGASEDASGILTVNVLRAQENSVYSDKSSGTIGYSYFTAGMLNGLYNMFEELYDSPQINGLDVTGNITVGGNVDGRNISSDGTKLDGIESGAQVNTVNSVNSKTGTITLVTGDISDTTSTQKYATAAQLTKINYLDVTSSVNINTMYDNIQTNNAKVSNATHTGDVTGATTLSIVPSAISSRTEVTPTNGDYILLFDATDNTLKKSLVDLFLVDTSGGGGGGSGDVVGPSGSTDNAFPLFDGTSGKLLKGTTLIHDNTGAFKGTTSIETLDSILIGRNDQDSDKKLVFLTTSGSTGIKGIDFYYNTNKDWSIVQTNSTRSLRIMSEVGGSIVIFPYDSSNIEVYRTINGRDIANDGTKLDLIDVTGSINLDTLFSAVTANSAKVTNANHTGDVTGADVLGIVPSAISGKTAVTPVSGDYVLLWDATDSLLKKADVSSFLSGGGGAVDSVNGKTGTVVLVTGDISDTTSTQKYATAAQLAKIDYLTVTQAVDLDTLESNVAINNAKISFDSTASTKVGYISVTQAVNLDTMESDIATNNAKVTNANHTGDVTGSAALTIVPSAISGKTAVTPATGDYVLIWDATDSTLKKSLVDTFISGGGGDVTGPSSSTNTAIAVFNGTGGKTLMSTSVTIDTSSVVVPGFLTVTGQARNSEQTALSTSGIVTWNINNNPIANILLAGDVTSFTISGINLNSNATLYIKQHASSAKTITWPSTIIWAGGYSPNLSNVGSKHIISMYSYDGTGLIASAISDNGLTTITNSGGTTLSNAIAIFDSTTGSAIKDGTGCLDISGNFTNILSINGTTWSTLVSDVATNSAKVSNATHTGEVTGSTSLVIDPTAISSKTAVTPVAGDYLLLWDATDSALKKVDATNFLGAGAVSSVNGFSGAVTLVTGNISDTTSTQKYATAAQLAKIDYLTVTQAVDLDTMESDIATNNAKVSNATHTGDVTGSSALTIVPSAISGKTAVTPASGDYVLLWDATDSTLKKSLVDTFISGGSGDVTGPASSTNTGIAIFNGIGGKTIMNSLVTVDTSSVNIPGFLTVTGQVRHSAQTALSTSAIVTWNVNNDPKASIQMTNDVTSFTISGININSNAVLYVKQHASAAKTISWPATIKWSGNTTPDISNLNSVNVFSFYSYDGTNLIGTHVTDQTSSFTPNANHTGDVTGATTLSIVPSAISSRTSVTAVAGDYVLLWDATDSLLKKADVTDFISAVTATSTTTFTNKRITRRVTTLTDAATIAINSDNMDMGKVTLTASRTLGTPTGTPTDGQPLLLEVVQGGTGSYTLTADSTSTAGSYRFGSDVTGFTLSTAVGKKDLILLTYLSDMTGWAVTAISKGYPA